MVLMNNLNKYLQKIINEYISYKHVFQNELIKNTEQIVDYTNFFYWYRHILSTTPDNILDQGEFFNFGYKYVRINENWQIANH